MGYTPSKVEQNFFVDSVNPDKRGTCFSVTDMLRNEPQKLNLYVHDTIVHDANFAQLSNALSKLHTQVYEPLYFTTWAEDIPANVGGGFVDFVSYFEIDWAGIMDQFRNVMGNNANYIPRVNAGVTQKKADVYTYEVAYDLRFIELEKMNKITIQKSIQDIYKSAITAGWDLFVQHVAYLGINNKTGLFNSENVMKVTIDNDTASDSNVGFKGMDDDFVVSFFNGIFETYLLHSNMNISILPDTILVPTFVQKDLVSRMSSLYTNTLYNFIIEHNLGTAQAADLPKIKIKSRTELNTLGTGGHGRIVAYKKNENFVRIDIPYPMQHYITLPNIERFGYTSAFVGQVSQLQLMYNSSADEFGVVTYFDFTK